MEKLLATGKTDLLQFVSARTKRGFAAFLVRQPDGKIGFEFETRDPAKAGARRARGGASALRVLGAHPRDKKPVELHAGRYGPYVKHGDINATIPDRDKVDTLTLDEAVALLDEKAGKQGNSTRTPARKPRKVPAKSAPEPRTAAVTKARAPRATKPASKKRPAGIVAVAKPAPAAKKTARARRSPAKP